eukprot:1157650-Pelagomonas_calceolata.AAC.7
MYSRDMSITCRRQHTTGGGPVWTVPRRGRCNTATQHGHGSKITSILASSPGVLPIASCAGPHSSKMSRSSQCCTPGGGKVARFSSGA